MHSAGGAFDPLGLASADDDKAFRLKTAEIKHGRLAMIAFLGETTLEITFNDDLTNGLHSVQYHHSQCMSLVVE